MAQVNLTLDSEILKGMFTTEGRDEAFAGLLGVILNQVLNAQASEQAGAGLYERSDSRCTYRNGCRERELYTRVEKLRLMEALLMEIREERQAVRVCLNMNGYLAGIDETSSTAVQFSAVS